MGRRRVTRDGSLGPDYSDRNRRPERRWRYTPEWRAASRAQIARRPYCEDPTCEVPVSRSNPLTADHIVPVSEGGAKYDGANLQTLCRVANSRKKDAVDE